jgi:DNA-binding MarR family transcriptional regulator
MAKKGLNVPQLQASQRPDSKEKMKQLLELPEVRSWRALMGAFNTIFSELEKGLVSEDCSISRFQILLHLYFEGTLAAVDIARLLLVTRGNISMFLRRMEADGLVKKRAPAGQKRPLYSLTAEGQRFFERIFPSHIQRVRSLSPVLDQKTIELLRGVAERKSLKKFN